MLKFITRTFLLLVATLPFTSCFQSDPSQKYFVKFDTNGLAEIFATDTPFYSAIPPDPSEHGMIQTQIGNNVKENKIIQFGLRKFSGKLTIDEILALKGKKMYFSEDFEDGRKDKLQFIFYYYNMKTDFFGSKEIHFDIIDVVKTEKENEFIIEGNFSLVPRIFGIGFSEKDRITNGHFRSLFIFQ